MSQTINQVDEFLKLAEQLGIEDTTSKTELSVGNRSYAGIIPYNPVPKSFYKIGDFAKAGNFSFYMPYSKPSSPEEEKAGKNTLNVFADPELDKEVIPTSIKGYFVEYNHTHDWSEFVDEKVINHCKVIGQKCGDVVTNEPLIAPIRWMYSKGSTNGYRVPSRSLEDSNAVGSNGLTCADCIRQGRNQGIDTKGKVSRCKEKGVGIFYVTHLGVFNKKRQLIDYTPVSEFYFASTWDLATGKTNVIRHDQLPCYINLSSSYIQGVFADPSKNVEAIDGFASFFEKIKKTSASSNFFNIVQWKVDITVVPSSPVNNLSFTVEGSYDSKELSSIIAHWKENKPEFVLQEVPFNIFTTELNGNYVPPSSDQVIAAKEEQEKAVNLDNF